MRRQLAERVTGRTIRHAEILDPRLVAPEAPEAVAARLGGQRVAAVERRAKYLLLRLGSGDTLVLHLRMTGRLHWHPPGGNGSAPGGPDRHLRARLALDDGGTLAFRDVRRFGTAVVLGPGPPDPERYWDRRAGVEPLSRRFTARALGDLLAGRRAPVKAALLDQGRVAGLGNIYVDEALWGARVHPLRPAGCLDASELRRLHRAIRERLTAGIAAGGASIDSYRDGLGRPGRMQDLLHVHLRAGEPCRRCGTVIVKGRVAGRGTYWCPRCQAAPAGAPC